MKIAIFENQYEQIRHQFEIANKLFFNDELVIDQFNSSQSLVPISKITDYNLVLVDISLSSNSDRDGFNLIAQIKKVPNYPKIAILTGNSYIEESLKTKELGDIPVIHKPVDPEDVGLLLKKLLSPTS